MTLQSNVVNHTAHGVNRHYFKIAPNPELLNHPHQDDNSEDDGEGDGVIMARATVESSPPSPRYSRHVAVTGAAVLLLLLVAAVLVGLLSANLQARLLLASDISVDRYVPSQILSSFNAPTDCCPRTTRRADQPFLSDRRGHIAVLYGGTIRTFSATFHSHLVNLFAPSPYTPHIFMHATLAADRMSVVDGNPTSTRDVDGESLYSTLLYWAEYDNVDGERVNLMRDVVHSIVLEWDVNSTLSRARYAAELSFLGEEAMAKQTTHPIYPIGALDSLSQAHQASVEHAKNMSIEYEWVVRIRYDASLKSNVWDGVFDIRHCNSPLCQPTDKTTPSSATEAAADNTSGSDGAWVADGHSTYVLHDTVWSSKKPSNNTVLIPPCDEFYGYNDQFAMGGPAAMSIYANRAHDLPLMQRAKAEDPKWNFHAETWLARSLHWYGINVTAVPMCYSIVHMSSTAAHGGDSFERSRRTSCRWSYGRDCCTSQCAVKHTLNMKWRQLFHSYSHNSHVEYAMPPSPDWSTGLNCNISRTSNWWHYYVTAPDSDIGCLEAEWKDRYDPYAFVPLPFIHPNADQLNSYLRRRTCISGF